MTATQLATRVLRWTLDPQGPVPSGILGEVDALARPTDELRTLVGAVAARHLARLRWCAPPLGDDRPVSGDLPLLAALVAQPAGAPMLLSAVDPPVSRWDWVARDAVVAPALRSPADTEPTERRASEAELRPAKPDAHTFTDELLRRSPLTALHTRPAPGDEDRALAWLVDLIAHSDGRRWLCRTLASPACAPDVLTWRVLVLDRLRHDQLPLVLEVYAAALVHHRDRLQEWTDLALQSLTSQHDPLLAWALTLGRWWQVLVQIDHTHHEAIRGHQALDSAAFERGSAGHALATAVRNLSGALA